MTLLRSRPQLGEIAAERLSEESPLRGLGPNMTADGRCRKGRLSARGGQKSVDIGVVAALTSTAETEHPKATIGESLMGV